MEPACIAGGTDIFGLMTPDGRQLSTQGNTATIAAGESLTFAVTFRPPDGQSFAGENQVTDTTAINRSHRSTINSALLIGVRPNHTLTTTVAD